MDRRAGRIAVAALLIVTTGLAATSPPTAGATADRPPLSLHNLSPEAVGMMWSLDGDPGRLSGTSHPFYDWLLQDRSFRPWLRVAAQSDRVQETPPKIAKTWTAGEFQELTTQSFGPRTSVYPQGAAPTSKTYIKDAHATVFSVTPSTKVVRSGGVTHFVAPTGTLRALVDYRVDTPDNKTTDPPDETVVKKKVTYHVRNQSIQSIKFRVDGVTEENLTGDETTHTPTFSYEDLPSGASELTVVARYNVTVNKTVVTTRRVPIDPIDDPVTTPGPGPGGNSTPATPTSTPGQTGTETATATPGDGTEYVNTTTVVTENVTQTVTVRTTVSISVYELPSDFTGYRATDRAGNTQGYAVSSQSDLWGGFAVGDTTVTTRWGYLTARDTRWDALIVADDASNSKSLSPAVPLQVYAVPQAEEPQATSGQGTDVVTSWGAMTPPPNAPGAFAVQTPAGQYRPAEGVAIETAESKKTKAVSVYGLVYGVNKTLATGTFAERSVYPSALNLSVVASNESHTVLSVTLTDAVTGDPISLGAGGRSRVDALGANRGASGRTGRIIVTNLRNDDRWTVRPADGQATIVSDSHGVFTATYKPASWAAASPAYEASQDSVKDLHLTIASMLDWILIVVFTFGPIALVYHHWSLVEQIVSPSSRRSQ